VPAGLSKRDESTVPLRRQPVETVAAVDIEVIAGLDRGAHVRLPAGKSAIGTAPHAALPLRDPAISRVHCEIRVDSGGVRIADCGSTNGTFVDGVEVGDAKLVSGTTVRVGETTLRVTFGDEPILVILSMSERFGRLIGLSAAMRRVYALLEAVSKTDNTVLVQGETGTGKEVAARSIHEASHRSAGPFVAVDCGALAETLIESELFGHVKGAFSGAARERRGLFEEAHGGTLFLDEIGELPLSLQPKLLRALEMREVRRVGGNTAKKLDVRVVAATHRPLARAVNEGTFREDLYYRLAVFEVVVPPLRERREDIPLLANQFYADIAGADAKLPPEVTLPLMHRGWPGNVRELRNFVERSSALGWSATQAAGRSAPRLDATTLGPALDALIPQHRPLKEARQLWIDQFESLYVAAVLRRTGGNVTRAAEQAGVNRRYLHRLISEHGVRGAHADSGGDEGDD
jgi:transcriptional regulator with GAF, ATPase, and Fis domain